MKSISRRSALKGIAATTGAGLLLSPTPPNAAANITDEANRQFEWLNVRDFGALGDGRTDDTWALRAAISEAIRAYDQSRVVYFPRGEYVVTQSNLFGQWKVPLGLGLYGLRIVGDGLRQTIIRLDNHESTDYWFYDDGASSPSGRGLLFPQFEGLRFLGNNKAAGSVNGFRLFPTPNRFPSQGFTFANCSVGHLDTWFDIRGNVNGSENKWINCRFSFLKTILRVDQTQAVNQVFVACDFENLTGDAFVLGSTNGMPSAITVLGGSVILRSDDDFPSESTVEWVPGKRASANDVVIWDGIIYKAQGPGLSGNSPPTHRTGTRSDGGVKWTAAKDGRFYFVKFVGTAPISRPLFSASNLKFELQDSRAKLVGIDNDGSAVQAVFRDCDLMTMVPRASLPHLPFWEPITAYSPGALVKVGANVYETIKGGVSGRFRPQHGSGIMGDNGISDWRFVSTAGTSTVVEVEKPGNQDILFDNCFIPPNARFRVGAPAAGRAGSTFSSYGNITLSHCLVDKRIADRFSAGSESSKFLVDQCWVNEARDSSGSDWMNWAIDCNQLGSAGVFNSKCMTTRSLNAFLSLPGPDQPSREGWLCRVVLPPNALVKNVFVKKQPGRGRGSYQLQVTDDDGSFVYGESMAAPQSALHAISVANLMRNVGVDMKDRTLRLRSAPGRHGDEAIAPQQGDFFIVEYL